MRALFPGSASVADKWRATDAKDFVEGHSVVTLDDGNVVAVSSDAKFFNPTMVFFRRPTWRRSTDIEAVVALPGRRVYALGGRWNRLWPTMQSPMMVRLRPHRKNVAAASGQCFRTQSKS